MGRASWLLLIGGAAISAVGDILLALLAAHRTGLYLLPWIVVGTGIALAKIAQAVVENKIEAKSDHLQPHVRKRYSGDEIFGRRQGVGEVGSEVGGSFLLGLLLSAVFAVGGIFEILEYYLGNSKLRLFHTPSGLAIFIWTNFLGWAGLALYYRYGLGLRSSLTVSGDGVVFVGKREANARRERVQIQWKDVVDFLVTERNDEEGLWLAATPPKGSPLIFRGSTARIYDSEQNLIFICNLKNSGIQEHVIVGALNHWRRPAAHTP